MLLSYFVVVSFIYLISILSLVKYSPARSVNSLSLCHFGYCIVFVFFVFILCFPIFSIFAFYIPVLFYLVCHTYWWISNPELLMCTHALLLVLFGLLVFLLMQVRKSTYLFLCLFTCWYVCFCFVSLFFLLIFSGWYKLCGLFLTFPWSFHM